MNTDHGNTCDTETDPAEFARTIETLERRIHARILTGEGFALGHGKAPSGSRHGMPNSVQRSKSRSVAFVPIAPREK